MLDLVSKRSFIGILAVVTILCLWAMWTAVEQTEGLVDSLWLFLIAQHERKVFSQNGEDGVLEFIFSHIRTTNKYFVEFGVEDGSQCNTRLLRERYGWRGLMMDLTNENTAINLHQETILPSNINELFEKHGVPDEFDLLSVDTDMNDIWIWHALDRKYKPRVLVAEYNRVFGSNDYTATENAEHKGWDMTCVFGASLAAFDLLLTDRGYKLVYVDKNGINAFFIRRDLLSDDIDEFLPFESVYPYHEQIHPNPRDQKLGTQVDFRKAVGMFNSRRHLSPGDYESRCSVLSPAFYRQP